ncbi:MAG: hypothetical protein L6R35_001165 [Caloplaca aegaea]|nr:MAG: hypothetical protein L6R35_001165 [Caloplaca aegaea]
MSTRTLRKLHREQEREEQLQALQDVSEAERSEDEQEIRSKTLNAFDMLARPQDEMSAEDDDEQDAGSMTSQASPRTDKKGKICPTQRQSEKQSKLKKKRKAKNKTFHSSQPRGYGVGKGPMKDSVSLDEIDLALKALSTHPSTSSAAHTASSSDAFPEMYQLLAIDSKNLNAANEMKRLFGNVIMESENEAAGQVRRRGRVQHLDLGGALAGRNSPVSRGQGLAGLALRRNVFMMGKEEWPKTTNGGLGMELVEKLGDGTVEYRFVHNTAYRDVQRQYEACVESLDPQRLIHLLQFNPYHISTLLQVSEIAKQQGDYSVSGDLIERALFSLGRSVHSSFITALADGKARLDFRRPENRELWLAAWRYVANLGQKGTWRTGYEWAKLVLSLDPEGDPYCVALSLDQLALRGGQAEHFLKLCGCAPLDSFLQRPSRPSLLISSALAKYRVKDAQGSRSQLRVAIAAYPYIFARLFQELNLENTPQSIWGQTPRTKREHFECEVYVHNAKDLWNTPEAISLLVEVAESVERGPLGSPLDHDITLDEARHILTSGIPALIDLLPRALTTLHTTSSDPLPPPDNLDSYPSAITADEAEVTSDVQPPAQAVAAPTAVEASDVNGEEMRELNGLQNFFSRFLPWAESREIPHAEEAFQRAADESGESQEVIRQRGNRFIQLLQRVVGMNVDAPSSHSTQATAEVLDQTAAEPIFSDGDAPGDEGYGDFSGAVPEPMEERRAFPTPQNDQCDDEKNQRWLAGQGMLRLREFTIKHGADEHKWGSHSAEGEALFLEYAQRVRQLRNQRTRNFIVNYSLQQGKQRLKQRKHYQGASVSRRGDGAPRPLLGQVGTAALLFTIPRSTLAAAYLFAYVNMSALRRATTWSPQILAVRGMATLPYIPVTALLSPVDDALVYILQPPTSTATSAQLLALNTTKHLHAASLPLATVANPLPFQEDSEGAALVYTSAVASNGNIYTYTRLDTFSKLFQLGIAIKISPPVAEAGFTLTPLRPSFTHLGDGEQLMTQNYVLLGGHTQTAFVNMSQVALLSLPEQSWSFLPVEEPGKAPKTDLTIRDGLLVEPRSGHTAVLTSDGKRIVMYGGWVGDIHTAAHPQLAVLELGAAYEWSVPDLAGVGPEEDTGTYGHGAVMLPGDVMMIIGGYSTSSPSSAIQKKFGLVENTNAYFLNTTSYSWISEYTRPRIEADRSASATPGSRSITASQRAGLGAGLVFGTLALVAVFSLYFWYARRLMRKREAYAEDLRNLGSGGQRAHCHAFDAERQAQAVSHRDSKDAYPWTTRSSVGAQSQPVDDSMPAQRSGLMFEIPSPTRGLRRSLHSRGVYQPAPRYDDSHINRSSGHIHPIDERDEYEAEGKTERTPAATGLAHGADYHILNSAPVFDPFQDPSEGSRSPSPHSPARERQLEIQRWVNDWAAADARIYQHAGRLSPDKTDRTSSTLSEQSMRSNWSGHSIGSFSRSMSQRSAALFSHGNITPNPTASPSPANELYNAAWMTSDSRPEHCRPQSLTMLPRRATTSDAMGSGAASVRQLQLESEALLGGYADAGSLSPRRTQSWAQGWMGSMRRALGGDRTASTSPEHGSSALSSPTKLQHDTGVPRRAVSAGAALWQKRQGAKDWDAEGGPSKKRTGEGSKANAEEEEWDVESAVERRVVQVMFTVPRAKLRVVNGAAEGDGDSVLSNEIKETEKEGDGQEKGKGKGKE